MPNLAPLKEGDHVAIIATAKRIEFEIEPALNVIKRWGLVPVLGKHALGKKGYFACQPEESLQDLQWALDDAKVKAIIFLRGGYGTTRILDQMVFPPRPKWFVGYSDLTSLILQLNRLNHAMVHGAMCSTLGNDEGSDNYLKAMLFGQKHFVFPLHASQLTSEGIVEGEMTGGNLSLIYESIGAANQINASGKILFLEEVGEQMYAIDRMLNKLKRIGALNELKGLIIGSFTGIGNKDDYYKESVEELICHYCSKEIPVAMGLSSGHDKANYPLLLGQQARISITTKELTIQYLEDKASN